MPDKVILYSGGADSTAALHYALCQMDIAKSDYGIVAFTIAEHDFLGVPQMEAQKKSREAFKSFLKDKGVEERVKFLEISMSFSSKWGSMSGGAFQEHNSAQPLIWLTALAQYLGKEDTLVLPYIKGDCFWHYRRMFEKALFSLCKLKGVHVDLAYPFEYQEKEAVLSYLDYHDISDECWFTCENPDPETLKPCGQCTKCKEVEKALPYKDEDLLVSSDRDRLVVLKQEKRETPSLGKTLIDDFSGLSSPVERGIDETIDSLSDAEVLETIETLQKRLKERKESKEDESPEVSK